jgi:general secretion pathway protein A
MYTSFFGLNEKPFTITPDPRYLFMSERHGEGLAHLVYGVTESGGFIQLTGEVGTGKTTLVRTLLGQIPSEVDIALILNPELTAREFLTAICEELGIQLPPQKGSTKALVDSLNRHLLEVHSRGRRTILLIDEAQNLSESVLEQLRLLTNLETARQKLLQIILIAQPELREKLALDSLRQLAQRVTGRYHLEPLSREETFQYIDHRLRVAGALTEIFNPAAKREIYRLSDGVPRVINVICDRALLGAYSRESRTIGKRLTRKAASEVSGQMITPALLKWAVPMVGVVGLIVVASLLWSGFNGAASDDGEPTDTVTLPLNGDGAIEPGTRIEEATQTAADADLEQLFAGHDDSNGFEALFGLWNLPYDQNGGLACDQAEAAGLSCYFQKGTWSTLRQLDRPVLITLTRTDGTTWKTALARLTENDAELFVGDMSATVRVSNLSDYWFGQFLLLWRPPNGINQALSPGMQHENVRWLRQSLAALDKNYQPAQGNSDFFDDELEQQLIDFQRQHRLDADGLAGQKTQIIINSLLALDGTPRLSETL